MKTLSELEPRAIEWGQSRGLFANTTPLKQAEKTLEEYGEVLEAIAALEANPGDDGLRRAVATELGDMIVTLIMQAHLQGTTVEDCLLKGSHKVAWDDAETWVCAMIDTLKQEPLTRVVALQIGVLYLCIADAAKHYCEATPEQCLELALNKIWDRQGEMIDGKFVKAEPCAD